MINKNTKIDKKKDTIYKTLLQDTIYNVSRIIECYSVKFIKCFKIYQHVITTCSGQPNPYLISVS